MLPTLTYLFIAYCNFYQVLAEYFNALCYRPSNSLAGQ